MIMRQSLLAPNDSKINCLILQYIRAMDMPTLFKFTNIFKSIDTQERIGYSLELCEYLTTCALRTYVCSPYICIRMRWCLTGRIKGIYSAIFVLHITYIRIYVRG